MKKIFLSLLTAITMTISLTGVLPAVTASADTTSGKCGANVTWTYDSDTYTLTLSGSGSTGHYATSGDYRSPLYPINVGGIYEHVVIEEGITRLGKNLFLKCGIKTVSLPKSLTLIEDGAFQLNSLTEVIIPHNVECIESYAFADCYSLSRVILEDGVERIRDCAFARCKNLKEITIPDSVTYISDRIFMDNLQDEYWEEMADNITIYCNSGSYAEYWAKKYNYEYVIIGQSTNPYVPTTATTTANKTGKTKSSSEKSSISASKQASRIAAKAQAAQKAMKQAKITKLTVKSKAKRTINVTWKKVSTAKGYQVQVSTNKKFKTTKIIFDKLTSKKTLKLKRAIFKSGKKYYVRVRAYTAYTNTDNKQTKVYSAWNKKLRKVKVK